MTAAKAKLRLTALKETFQLLSEVVVWNEVPLIPAGNLTTIESPAAKSLAKVTLTTTSEAAEAMLGEKKTTGATVNVPTAETAPATGMETGA